MTVRTCCRPVRRPVSARGRVMVWSIVGVLVVGGGGGAAWYAMHRDSSALASDPGKAPPSSPASRTTASDRRRPSPKASTRVKEKGLGVSFPVPDGWKRVVRDGGRQILYTQQRRTRAS